MQIARTLNPTVARGLPNLGIPRLPPPLGAWAGLARVWLGFGWLLLGFRLDFGWIWLDFGLISGGFGLISAGFGLISVGFGLDFAFTRICLYSRTRTFYDFLGRSSIS